MFILIFFSFFWSCSRNSDKSQNNQVNKAEEKRFQIPEAFVYVDQIKSSETTRCEACDHVIALKQQIIDGNKLGIEAGDVICLSGEIGGYDRLTFINLNGTPDSPIQIKNCNGQAIINSDNAFGVKVRKSTYFEIIGSGDSNYQYGIKISTKKGFYLSLEDFTTNFTISQIEIAGNDLTGFAGIGIKTSPYQNCKLFENPARNSWVMKNVTIENCFIHDTGGEGLYIGHGFYNGRLEKKCSDTTYSHSIHNLTIANNIIQNVGYDGIQIKNADDSCYVYKNYIDGFGLKNEGGHNEGLFIGEGTTGLFSENIITNGTGHGIQLQGIGNITIVNNIILDVEDHGFYAASGPHAFRLKNGYFNILNNTFVDFETCGFAFFNNDGGIKRVHNNAFISSIGRMSRKGAKIDSSHNVFTKDVNSFRIKDQETGRYTLIQNIRLTDRGFDTNAYFVDNEINEKSRLKNPGNIGAIEF